jgi:hypothetical protein
VEIRPQPGKQEKFLGCRADIAVYGGSAGAGKSYALLLEPLRHISNPGFGGVIFRRTSPQLTGPGSLWEGATQIYPLLGAELRNNPSLAVTFPTGATLHFTHLQYNSDAVTHHGKQYAFVGFDEVQMFEEYQFWYLLSRMRTMSGVRAYMRCTCNPDPDSFIRELIDWWIGPDGYPLEDRCGLLRWFVRRGGVLYWADTKQALLDQFGDDIEPLSFTFIGAKLDDNPALTNADPGYRARLEALPEIERVRLLGGNWDIRPDGGKYVPRACFEKRWVSQLNGNPNAVLLPARLNHYIASDFAVTEPEDSNSDPDFTEHGVFGLDDEGNVFVLDWWYGQTTSDVWIETLIDLWEKWKPLAWFGEGGVIRRAVEPSIMRRMKERRAWARREWLNPTGRTIGHGSSKEGYADRSKQAKAIRGRPFQAMAHSGKIIFPQSAPWLNHVLELIVNFPAKGHDDPFDVVSLICSAIDIAHPAVTIIEGDTAGPEDYPRKGSQASWRTP